VLEVRNQLTFEEQERLYFEINHRCQDTLQEIIDNPTEFSAEELHPVMQVIQQKAQEWLEDLYQRSTPEISLRLAIEAYTPDLDQKIEVQVVVENRMGRSPVEALELVVLEEPELFVLLRADLRLEGALRGGETYIILVPVQVLDSTLRSGVFSMSVFAQYRTRANEVNRTSHHAFPIRLYIDVEFTPIDNPYAAYAQGGIVNDPSMFYGRSELISYVLSQLIRENSSRSKCIIFYGQKRVGKSSILHHLKLRLETNARMLVVILDHISVILDDNARVEFEYRFYWNILSILRYAIEDRTAIQRVDQLPRLPTLDITIPTFEAFVTSSSPLQFFKETMTNLLRAMSRDEAWRNIRIVLLIDEFSYLYWEIMRGRIADSFMKSWKSLLEANFFDVILVGQDVMRSFIQRYPNEFGITQTERIGYLLVEDARRLIDEPIRIGGSAGESRYREQAIERILELTAGNPFYIQIICAQLVEYMNRKRIMLITRADVEQVTDGLIRGVNTLGLDKFDNLVNSGDFSSDAISDHDILVVLREIARNSQTGPCSRTDISCETSTPIDVILDDLVSRDVLERERSQYYQIRVSLFKEWLLNQQ
jgi:hypothetical protein